MSQEYMGTAVGVKEPSRIRVAEKPLRRYAYMFLKRVFDIAVSFCGIVVLSPIFILLALIVYFSDPGPVFYRHKRVGKDRKKIRIWKFRSMYINSEEF